MIRYREKWRSQNLTVSAAEEKKNIDYLNAYFKDVPFTPEEEKALINLATFNRSTLKTVLKAIKKAYAKNHHQFTSNEGGQSDEHSTGRNDV